jgi:hypothetical protein
LEKVVAADAAGASAMSGTAEVATNTLSKMVDFQNRRIYFLFLLRSPGKMDRDPSSN